MTSRIIYHDFRQAEDTVSEPEFTSCLTSIILEKGRRFLRTISDINAVMNAACTFFCGACMGVGLLILLVLGSQ